MEDDKKYLKGTTTVGIVCKDGVLLLADKRVIDKLIVTHSIEKVFQVDEHIAAAASGIMSDARILIEKAQVIAQQYRVAYDEPMEPASLIKEVSNLKQAYTQYGGARPFGVSLLFAGVNDGPQLFLTDPTGIHWEYKATAIGEFEDELKEILSKNYKDNLSLEEGIKLAVNSLKKVLGKDFNLDRLDGCSISTSDKKFKRLTREHIRKCLK